MPNEETINDVSEISISIDFGTSNLKVAVFNSERASRENGDIDKIFIMDLSTEQGSNVIPNILNIGAENVFSIGSADYSGNVTVVKSIKRHIEEENWTVYVPARQRNMTIDEVLKEAFEWIREKVFAQFNKNPKDTVITVPVCFSEMQKQRIRKAATAAGLNVKEVLTEPFAGLFSYYRLFNFQEMKPINVLVFDFGGSTLYMSIIKISPNETVKVNTLAAIGKKYGGEDLTNMIYENLFSQYKSIFKERVDRIFKRRYLDDSFVPEEDKNLKSEIYKKNYEIYFKEFYNQLFSEINDFKEKVCSTDNMTFDTDECEIFQSLVCDEISSKGIQLSYNGFVDMLEKEKLGEKIRSSIELISDKALLDITDIDKIMMIGGTSKIRYFRNILMECAEIPQEDYNKKFIEIKDSEKLTAVAIGALTYFKMNNITFDASDMLSYEIGIIENNKYITVRTSDTALGEWTSFISVMPEELDSNYLKVKMYQIFDDTTSYSDRLEEPIYMGYFRLDKKVFCEGNKYLMAICVDKKCELYANFYDPKTKVESDNPLEKVKITLEA